MVQLTLTNSFYFSPARVSRVRQTRTHDPVALTHSNLPGSNPMYSTAKGSLTPVSQFSDAIVSRPGAGVYLQRKMAF